MRSPYQILDRKRRGERLNEDDVMSIVAGTTDGTWEDSQLAAFLMAAAIHGLDGAETRALTRAMLGSGDQWDLASAIDLVGDKHSTGGVGDKTSLIIAPLLATCGLPIAMLTGRGLGHTGGTADKLEGIPGLDLALSRRRVLALLDSHRMAIGMATQSIAPADRRLYALRDVTGTVASLPLITASILSKKLAMGASGVVYDVKVGSGAFLADLEEARELAGLLVATSEELGSKATALITDMSQPLGRWVGHHAEVSECLQCLAGEGPEDLGRLTEELAVDLAVLLDADIDRQRIRDTLDSGAARETFLQWAGAQGARASWLMEPVLPLAPMESVLHASASGRLQTVDTRSLGLTVAAAGGGRHRPGDAIDHAVALRYDRRIGETVRAGEELGRVYSQREDEELIRRLESCFVIGEPDGAVPPLVVDRVGGGDPAPGTVTTA